MDINDNNQTVDTFPIGDTKLNLVLEKMYQDIVLVPNKEWLEEIKQLTDKDAMEVIERKIIFHAEQAIDSYLPEIWVELVDLIENQELKEKCQNISIQNDDVSKLWFRLPQEGRDSIASIETAKVLSKILEIVDYNKLFVDPDNEETKVLYNAFMEGLEYFRPKELSS